MREDDRQAQRAASHAGGCAAGTAARATGMTTPTASRAAPSRRSALGCATSSLRHVRSATKAATTPPGRQSTVPATYRRVSTRIEIGRIALARAGRPTARRRRPRSRGRAGPRTSWWRLAPRQPSASALSRSRVSRMPARWRSVNASTPSRYFSVKLIDRSVMPSGLSRRCGHAGPAAGERLELEGPDQPVLLDLERELAGRLEALHPRVRRPDHVVLLVVVDERRTQADRVAVDRAAHDLRAPGRHPLDVGDQRPHLLGCGVDLDGGLQHGGPGSSVMHRQAASASALIRSRVLYMPSWSSPVNLGTPPMAIAVDLGRELRDALRGLAALGDAGAAVGDAARA